MYLSASSYLETVHTLRQFIPGTVHTLRQFIPWDSSYPETVHPQKVHTWRWIFRVWTVLGMNCLRVWTVPGYELSRYELFWVWTVLGMNWLGMNCLGMNFLGRNCPAPAKNHSYLAVTTKENTQKKLCPFMFFWHAFIIFQYFFISSTLTISKLQVKNTIWFVNSQYRSKDRTYFVTVCL